MQYVRQALSICEFCLTLVYCIFVGEKNEPHQILCYRCVGISMNCAVSEGSSPAEQWRLLAVFLADASGLVVCSSDVVNSSSGVDLAQVFRFIRTICTLMLLV